MTKELKKEKCEECHKHKATYECEECGRRICGYCARKTEYECLVCYTEPPMYYPIKEEQ